MSSGSASDLWRRLLASVAAGLRSEPVAAEERAAFHRELQAAAVERMNAFCWLLFGLHVVLLVRDVTLDVKQLPAAEVLWSRWLFGLHVAIALASGSALALLALLKNGSARARVAFVMMSFLLAWSGLVSGADQLIGAGITLFLIMNLSSALFVTFPRAATAQAFAFGFGSFVLGQLWFAPQPALAFSQLVNGTALAFTCWLFSRMLYGSKARDFMQRTTIARQHAELEKAHTWLAEERARSERVLYAVLPPRIAERLRQGESPIADVHPELTIVFADLAGFTHLAAELPPTETVEILNELFSLFDEVVAQYRLEKIKTVGDAYLAVRGLAAPCAEDVVAAANAGLALHKAVLAVARRRNRTLSLRVGIARGVAMAGVLGRERLLYDLWGDCVNMASRLETAASNGETLIPDDLSPLLDASHQLGPVKMRELKGKGEVATRLVISAREEPASHLDASALARANGS
jgi:class 3 adenylate cyclase